MLRNMYIIFLSLIFPLNCVSSLYLAHVESLKDIELCKELLLDLKKLELENLSKISKSEEVVHIVTSINDNSQIFYCVMAVGVILVSASVFYFVFCLPASDSSIILDSTKHVLDSIDVLGKGLTKIDVNVIASAENTVALLNATADLQNQIFALESKLDFLIASNKVIQVSTNFVSAVNANPMGFLGM